MTAELAIYWTWTPTGTSRRNVLLTQDHFIPSLTRSGVEDCSFPRRKAKRNNMNDANCAASGGMRSSMQTSGGQSSSPAWKKWRPFVTLEQRRLNWFQNDSPLPTVGSNSGSVDQKPCHCIWSRWVQTFTLGMLRTPKLWEARSPLYRNRFLQGNPDSAACSES